MNTRLIIFVFVIATLTLRSTCFAETLTEPQTIRIREVGEKSANLLLKTLKEKLVEQVSKNGPVRAVEFCSLEALPLTKDVENKLTNGVAVKRTSRKVRNPKNEPDALELEALSYFEEQLASTGKLPEYFIQPDSNKDNPHARYYKPLVTNTLCLTCHGDRGSMQPDLRNHIADLYPNDAAFGYHENDLRGLVRVSVPLTTAAD